MILSLPQVIAQPSRLPLGLLKLQLLQQGHMGELLSTQLLPPSNHLQVQHYLQLRLKPPRCLSPLNITQVLPPNSHHIGPRYPHLRATNGHLFIQRHTICKRTRWDLERSLKLQLRVTSYLKGPEEEVEVPKEEEGIELDQCDSLAQMVYPIEAGLRSLSVVNGELSVTTFSHPKPAP